MRFINIHNKIERNSSRAVSNRFEDKKDGKSSGEHLQAKNPTGPVQRRAGDRMDKVLIGPFQTESTTPEPTHHQPQLVQRVKTPPVPDISEIPESGFGRDWWHEGKTIDKEKFYKNYLLTLKWQMMTNKQKDNPIMALLDSSLNDTSSVTPAKLNELISTINELTPGAKETLPEQKEPLKDDENGIFKDVMNAVQGGIRRTQYHKDAISATFGDDSRQTAIDNYNEIAQHLQHWQKQAAINVTINRAPNAGYKAYNQGLNKKNDATLTLGNLFFKEPDAIDTQATLVHEASHGRLGTTDIAYKNAPYFSKIKGNMALKNADHYAAAFLLTHEQGAGGQAGRPLTSNQLNLFQQGMSLCYYKLSKVWPVLMWMIDKYKGEGRAIHPDTLETNESNMELGGSTDKLDIFKPIAAERTLMLKEIIDFVKGYTQTPATFTEEKTSITVKPLNTTWPEVKFPVGLGANATSLTRTIFVTLFEKASGFSKAQSEALFKWSDDLFENATKDLNHRQPYNISDEDMELYNILKG